MCAYKPPSISNQTIRGMARVMLSKKDPSKVRVELTRKGENGAEETDVYVLAKENCPKYIKSGLWRVSLNSTGEKMWSAIPSDANVICQFSGISHKENEPPTPKTISGGKFGDYQQFILNLKVIEGEYEGLEIPVFLRYHFGPIVDNGKEVVAYTHDGGQAKHTPFLRKVLDGVGVWEAGAMKYEDNILPKIQKRAMKEAENGRKEVVAITDGNVTNVKQYIEDSWDDEEEAENASEPVNASKSPVTEPDPDDDVEEPEKVSSNDDEIPWGDDDTEG